MKFAFSNASGAGFLTREGLNCEISLFSNAGGDALNQAVAEDHHVTSCSLVELVTQRLLMFSSSSSIGEGISLEPLAPELDTSRQYVICKIRMLSIFEIHRAQRVEKMAAADVMAGRHWLAPRGILGILKGGHDSKGRGRQRNHVALQESRRSHGCPQWQSKHQISSLGVLPSLPVYCIPRSDAPPKRNSSIASVRLRGFCAALSVVIVVCLRDLLTFVTHPDAPQHKGLSLGGLNFAIHRPDWIYPSQGLLYRLGGELPPGNIKSAVGASRTIETSTPDFALIKPDNLPKNIVSTASSSWDPSHGRPKANIVSSQNSDGSSCRTFAQHIGTDTSARSFLEWCKHDFYKANRPKVRRLTIKNLGPRAISPSPPVISYAVFEDILEALAPELRQLKVGFSNCFQFSHKLLTHFKRANQLSVLHLQSSSSHPQVISQQSSEVLAPPYLPQLYDPHQLFTALASLPNLVQLDLNDCLDYCSPLTFYSAFNSLPPIRHLIVNVKCEHLSFSSSRHMTLRHLCATISDSLKVLEIRGARYNPAKFVQVLATVQQGLEALSLSNISLVEHCNRLEFSRLRTLQLNDSRYLSDDAFHSGMFQQLVTLLIRTWNVIDEPLVIPLGRLTKLRRVILTHATQSSPDTIVLSKACQASNVDCLLTNQSVELIDMWALDASEPQPPFFEQC
ncbi:hypothetical protein O181_020644 [Austropuccinia psidii MF-1]|uniref:F-box domain-containing protein n=1 Tax=Austropuccinia psidii MF-1 TaxID=1389203 RepID=A0A9Q3C9B0_9BASI|nr:hypothetical protein [Austropuccinia psidii MF-1]